MKKLIIIFSMLSFMAACSDDDDNNDKLPIKGLELPSSTTPVKPGATVTIKGEGFTKASEIWFRTPTTKAVTESDIKATVNDVSITGISFIAPMVFGDQNVLLKENGKEYELGKMTFEAQPEGEDEITILTKKVTKIIVLVNGESRYPDTVSFSYNKDGKIIAQENESYTYENNRIVRTGKYSKGSYDLKDGKATIIKSEEIGSKEHEEYALSYNTADYLETAKSKWYKGEIMRSEETEVFTFTNGYITGYTYKEDDSYHGEYIYEYGDFKRINNTNIDLWGILGGYSIFDSNIGEAFTLGVISNRCKYLPVKLKASETREDDDDKISTDTYEENFEYVVNTEGYVTKITITGNDKVVDWIFEIQYEK
ncbi:MAG: hypothetical protein RSB69_01360 [Odoribacter sp.]